MRERAVGDMESGEGDGWVSSPGQLRSCELGHPSAGRREGASELTIYRDTPPNRHLSTQHNPSLSSFPKRERSLTMLFLRSLPLLLSTSLLAASSALAASPAALVLKTPQVTVTSSEGSTLASHQ